MNAQPAKDAAGKQWEYYTDMPVGEILRRARVHYSQSLDDVEAVLRIRAQQLGAIEEGKLDELPGRVYAIGFVRSYAEYLGLDGDKMVHLFKIQSVGNKAKPELNFPVAASDSKLPGVFLIAASLAAVILIAVMFSIFGGSKKISGGPEEIPSVSDDIKAEATKPVPTSLPAPAPQQVAAAPAQTLSQPVTIPGTPALPGAAAPTPSRIVIGVQDNTWVEIRNSAGKPIISQVLNPGETYMVPNETGLVLATGNIGGLEFTVDGQIIPALGAKGDVARGIKLDPDSMKPASLRNKVLKPVVSVTPAGGVPAATSPAWQSAIKPAPANGTMPPQPTPVQMERTRLKPQDEAYKPIRIPGASSGTVR
jgi:cytoskeleton protein RodZ